MLSIETGRYYNLGRVGGKIWALLEKEITFSLLIDSLMNKYEVDRSKCENETAAFLQILATKGLISIGKEPAQGGV